ncbi:molybdopterin-dependent oxidoreductase [Sporomusa acidovorans]|uniref:Acetylene hydratase n=1 Tax=Sporomusa acidovorans (strain ATCC 49682 / DSM 3132 / Mol) TaxID=1123286 RepID=A0ABZ3J7B4_SPOA4|nr:molybdopterin-dependent oxidoreductase [Sporomusa acidovorans]OZC21052.1 acetylene hydratase [Sporomusa acidovorans DSM 3132]SDF17450.1 Anaerobic selenocysteine-containing dehydrogenase [Sporomusa acidovorans]
MAVVNTDVYKEEYQWQEGEYTVTRNTQWSAPGCHNGCGVLFYTKNGKVEKIEGDPNNPYNNGRLCMRCLNLKEALYHKDRLKWPLKRKGARGENKWERISWDEAFDYVAENVCKIQKEYGPEAIIGMEGTGRNVIWEVPYLTYGAFGSPNFTLGFLSGDSCYLPRTAANYVQNGGFNIVDCSQTHPLRYQNPEWKVPGCIVVWGNNPIISNGDNFLGHWIVDCMRLGTKLIVVDPSLTWLASRADVWLRVRPGTDAALAMAMINIIIQEKLYDKEFVEKWTFGFEELAERVKDWTSEKVAEITWIPQDLIVQAARLYATTKPAAIQWGLAVDQAVTGISCAHAISDLRALTGNIDVPGGDIMVHNAYHLDRHYNCGIEHLAPGMEEKRLGFDRSPMHQNHMDASAHGDSVLEAMESGKPYPVKMLWLQSTNPISCMASEAPRVYDAMKKMDFNVVVDVFMTPTAVAAADLVLPCSMSCERNGVRSWWTPIRAISKITQYEECKTDIEIILGVGKRLNPKAFPWETEEDMINWYMQTDGKCDFSFADLKNKVYDFDPYCYTYKKYEKGLLREDGQPGFETTTGKFEFKISLFEMWDLDALPWYKEPPESPVSTPEAFKEYPLVLTTGHRSWEFFHSEHRQLPTMREFHPNPLVDIHPETAAQLGVKEGDWVWIENMRGRCKQIVKYNETLHPKVVRAEHAWWFPEKDPAEPSLFGVFDSNINNLTQQCINGPTGYGSPYKNTICKIYKVTKDNEQVLPTKIITEQGGFGYVRNVQK